MPFGSHPTIAQETREIVDPVHAVRRSSVCGTRRQRLRGGAAFGASTVASPVARMPEYNVTSLRYHPWREAF